MSGKLGGGFLAPVLLSAVATAGLGVAINYATEWKTSFWAWAAVAVITVLVAGATLWLVRRQAGRDAQEHAGPIVKNARIGRDNIQVGPVGGNVTIRRDV